MVEGSQDLVWVMSTRCDSGACLEAAVSGGQVYVRQSESPDGPWLAFPQDAWREFIEQVRLGAFDSE